MALEAGSVFSRLGALFERRGFDEFGRATDEARREAARPVVVETKATVDDASFAKAQAATLKHRQAILGVEDATLRLAAAEKRHGQDSNEYRRAAIAVEQAQNRVTMALDKTTEAAVTAGAAIGSRGVTANVGALTGSLQVMVPAAAAAVPVLFAVGGAATALVSSLAAATAGAGALGTGLAAGLAPVLGLGVAVANRFSLIGDAITALTKQEDQAATASAAAATAQVASAARVKSAKQSLADTERAATRTQEDLTRARVEARQELDDLADSATRAGLAEDRAAISLREAVKELARVESDPRATRLELDSARQSVREAKQSAKDAKETRHDAVNEHRKAAAAGVEGMDRVRAAATAAADAERQVRRATEQVSAAQEEGAATAGKQTAAVTAAQLALSKLSDTEKKFVETWRSVSDQVKAAVQPATDAVIGALTFGVERAGDVVDKLSGRFGDLGDRVGGIIRDAAEALSSPAWVNALDRFITGGGRIAEDLGRALGSVANILRDVALASLPLVERGLEKVADWFGELDQRATRGKIRGVVEDLVEHTSSWLDLIGAASRLVFNLFNTGADDGRGLVDVITDLLNRWADWLDTEHGQKRMREFIRDSITLVKNLAGIIGDVGGALVKAADVGIDAFNLLWPVIKVLKFALDQSLPSVGKLTSAWDALKGAALLFAELARGTVVGAFDLVLGAITTVLGAVGDFLEFASKIPGVGGKFKGLAEDVRIAKDAINEQRESLRDAGKDALKFGEDTEQGAGRARDAVKGLDGDHRDVVRNIRSRWRELRDATDVNLKDVREQVRSSMVSIRARLGEDTEAGKDAAVKNFRLARRGIRDAMKDGTIDVKEGTAEIKRLMVRELKVYGLSANQARKYMESDSGDYRGVDNPNPGGGHARGGWVRRAAGGWIGGRGMVSDDVVPIAPGVMAAFGEYDAQGPGRRRAVINRHQAPVVDVALAAGGYPGLDELPAGRQLPTIERALAPLGGLDALFSSITRPHYLAGGGIVPVPGFPGERAAKAILGKIAAIKRKFPAAVLTDAFGPGHKSPGHTVFGTATDWWAPDRIMDKMVRWLTGQGILVGYDGRFGSQDWAGHGPAAGQGGRNAHLHAELGGAGDLRGAAASIKAPRTRMRGLLGSIAQGALNLTTAGANSALERAAAASVTVPMPGGKSAGADPTVVSAFRRAGASTKANWLERLGLFEAGIVESGLRNLDYGDADSLGALQERVSIYGRAHALNPFASASRFLRDAIALRPWRSSAGLLAAAVQRPAAQFVGRYDQVAAQARRYLGAGGRVLQRLAPGGWVIPGTSTAALTSPGIGAWSKVGTVGGRPFRVGAKAQTARVARYDDVKGDLATLVRQYTQQERTYNLTDEVLVDPDTGELNQAAIDQRAGELEGLIKIRERIVRKYEEAQRIAQRIVDAYNEAIRRLTRSLGHAKKKDRKGIRDQIDTARGNRDEWADTLGIVGLDLGDARLDVEELRKEVSEVRGTKATPSDGEAAGAGETDPDLEAVANQATARAAAAEADLATARQNLTAATGPGTIGAGGATAWQAGIGGPIGVGPATGAVGAMVGGGVAMAGPSLVVEVHSFVPPSGSEAVRLGRAVASSLDAQPYRTATRQEVR